MLYYHLQGSWGACGISEDCPFVTGLCSNRSVPAFLEVELPRINILLGAPLPCWTCKPGCIIHKASESHVDCWLCSF